MQLKSDKLRGSRAGCIGSVLIQLCIRISLWIVHLLPTHSRCSLAVFWVLSSQPRRKRNWNTRPSINCETSDFKHEFRGYSKDCHRLAYYPYMLQKATFTLTTIEPAVNFSKGSTGWYRFLHGWSWEPGQKAACRFSRRWGFKHCRDDWGRLAEVRVSDHFLAMPGRFPRSSHMALWPEKDNFSVGRLLRKVWCKIKYHLPIVLTIRGNPFKYPSSFQACICTLPKDEHEEVVLGNGGTSHLIFIQVVFIQSATSFGYIWLGSPAQLQCDRSNRGWATGNGVDLIAMLLWMFGHG